METISWRCRKRGDLLLDAGGKNYLIWEVAVLQAMRALITREADSMSAMKFRMSKAVARSADGDQNKEEWESE